MKRFRTPIAIIATAVALSCSPAEGVAVDQRPLAPGSPSTPTATPTRTQVKLRPVTRPPDRDEVIHRLRGVPALLPVAASLGDLSRLGGDLDCDLSTEDVHARKSSNYRNIGPKPMTVCSHKVQLIVHITKLLYWRNGRWVTDSVHGDSDANLKIHVTLDFERKCTGTAHTKWVSETWSFAVDHVREFQGEIRSSPRIIACAP